MCTNKREIILSTGRTMYVNCGHCAACLQEKALRRANRIRYEDQADNGLYSWFVTLTYDNKFIPYIRPSDVYLFIAGEKKDIPLYRDNTCYWVTKNVPVMIPGKRKKWIKSGKKERKSVLKVLPNIQPLERYKKDDFKYYGYEFDFSKYEKFNFPLLQQKVGIDSSESIPDKTSVLYYKDWQNFIFRLRNVLKRDYGLKIDKENFKYSCTGEYGSHTHRCHFHALIWTPEITSTDFASAVVKAWPFADPARQRAGVERNYDASSYISSYINSNKSDETFFSYSKPFRGKQKFSNAFAMDLNVFSPKVLREKFFGKNLRMSVQRTKEGKLTENIFVYPAYVVNYVFPKFKGYNRLTPDEIQRIVSRPDLLATKYYAERLGFFKSYDSGMNPLLKEFRFRDVENDNRFYGFKLNKRGRYQPNEGRDPVYKAEVEFIYQSFDGSDNVYTSPMIDWKAVFALIRKLKRKCEAYCKNIGFSNELEKQILVQEYAYIYAYIWSLRDSHIITDAHNVMSDNRHYVYFYDNIEKFYAGAIQHELLYYAVCDLTVDEIQCLPRSPNQFPDNIQRTVRMIQYHHLYDKSHRVRNYIQPRFYYNKRKIS